ncbi:MAG: SpaA isopeptide-forming pilin-related protein [Lachnospiraceae bacterium]|nr:SpaA isopeptide-forming pilin-related protein [Lachnospiraceae bacterium]
MKSRQGCFERGFAALVVAGIVIFLMLAGPLTAYAGSGVEMREAVAFENDEKVFAKTESGIGNSKLENDGAEAGRREIGGTDSVTSETDGTENGGGGPETEDFESGDVTEGGAGDGTIADDASGDDAANDGTLNDGATDDDDPGKAPEADTEANPEADPDTDAASDPAETEADMLQDSFGALDEPTEVLAGDDIFSSAGFIGDQGMYRISCAGNQQYVVALANGQPTLGKSPIIEKWSGKDAQCWIIRRAQGNYVYIKSALNDYASGSIRPTISNESDKVLVLKEGWYRTTTYEQQLFLPVINDDGSVTFLHKKTGYVLDVTGGTIANGTVLQLHKSNGTAAQKFFLTSLKQSDINAREADRVSAEPLNKSRLSILNLNSSALAQNTMATARSLTNVRTGSGVTLTAEIGFANKSNWSLSAEGTLLPAYRAVMSAASQGSEDEFVEVTYPLAGTYLDGYRVRRVGARVRFDNIRPANSLTQAYDHTAAPAADGKKYLVISTNMFGGYWYNNIEMMDVTVSFFYADTGENFVPQEAYLTFNSLNNNKNPENTGYGVDIAIPSHDGYGEFAGVKDKAVTGYVSGVRGNAASSDDEAVTNIVSLDLNVRAPYAPDSEDYGWQPVFIGQARYYPGSSEQKQATWTDALGGTNFTRNSVSLPLENESPATTYVIGSLKGEAWNSFSSVPIYAAVEPPVKSIIGAGGTDASFDSNTAHIAPDDGTVTFQIDQTIPRIGVETGEMLEYLILEDYLPEEFEVVSAQVSEPRLWGLAWFENWVRCRYDGAYDDSGTSADGTMPEAYTVHLTITARLVSTEAAGKTLTNQASVRWKMQSHEEEKLPSNEVEVVVGPPKGCISVRKLTSDENGSAKPLSGTVFTLSTSDANGQLWPVKRCRLSNGAYRVVRADAGGQYEADLEDLNKVGILPAEPLADYEVITDGAGYAVFSDLPDGTYLVTEKKAPTADGQVYELLTQPLSIRVSEGRTRTVTVRDSRAVEILNTGGKGQFYWIPALFCLGFAILLRYRRRRSHAKIK